VALILETSCKACGLVLILETSYLLLLCLWLRKWDYPISSFPSCFLAADCSCLLVWCIMIFLLGWDLTFLETQQYWTCLLNQGQNTILLIAAVNVFFFNGKC